MKYLKPYLYVQYPLFLFGKNRKVKLDTVECSNFLGKVEMDVVTAIFCFFYREREYRKAINVCQRDIAYLLGKESRSYSAILKKAINNIASTVYTIKTDNQEIKTPLLWIVRRGTGRNLSFDISIPTLIAEEIEDKKYQILDFEKYMSFTPGIERRCYEYLGRREKEYDGKFQISTSKFCQWLGINAKRDFDRKKTIRKTLKSLIKNEFLHSFSEKNDVFFIEFAYVKKALTPEQKYVLDQIFKNNQPKEEHVAPDKNVEAEISYLRDFMNRHVNYNWEKGYGKNQINKYLVKVEKLMKEEFNSKDNFAKLKSFFQKVESLNSKWELTGIRSLRAVIIKAISTGYIVGEKEINNIVKEIERRKNLDRAIMESQSAQRELLEKKKAAIEIREEFKSLLLKSKLDFKGIWQEHFDKYPNKESFPKDLVVRLVKQKYIIYIANQMGFDNSFLDPVNTANVFSFLQEEKQIAI